ncbi:collectin-12-like [Ahaetulla prasina]|uniref:collectin-12-like n=1 Tax=Ahaetulla prasina TaxID=499056 RepID=UPI002648C5A6|nr:collectin-12-like [Ahaetulla prasina]
MGEDSIEEKRKVSLQKTEEQLLRIEKKLGRLQNCRASPETQRRKDKQGRDSLVSIPSQVSSPALFFIKLPSIHQFFLPVVSAPIFKTILLYNFPVSEISWQTNVYYFSDTEENWEMARKKCADRDSHLLIINTKQEQDFVIQTLKQSIWLGLSDIETEGTWRWVDGSPLEKWSWRTGEPNNDGKNGEDCAVLYKEGKWNDIHCNARVKFVCEKEEVSVQ